MAIFKQKNKNKINKKKILPWLTALQSQWAGIYTLISRTISFIIEMSYKDRTVSLIHFPVNSAAGKFMKKLMNMYVK